MFCRLFYRIAGATVTNYWISLLQKCKTIVLFEYPICFVGSWIQILVDLRENHVQHSSKNVFTESITQKYVCKSQIDTSNGHYFIGGS